MNQCWFAARIIKVRRKYGLTIDRREADALEQVLSSCPSTELVVHACAVGSPASSDPPASHSATALETDDALGLWDDTATDGSPAARRGGTASHRYGAAIRLTPSCATAMAMGCVRIVIWAGGGAADGAHRCIDR